MQSDPDSLEADRSEAVWILPAFCIGQVCRQCDFFFVIVDFDKRVGGRMSEQRLIDVVALEKDLRKQFKDVFGKAEKKVKPEDYFIKRRSAFHAAFIEAELQGFIEYLKSRPTVDPMKRGKWVCFGKNQYSTYYKCSICGAMYAGQSNYCPNCGAKMDKEG